jgi:hypothetical protein
MCHIHSGSAIVGNCFCGAWRRHLNSISRGTIAPRRGAKRSEKHSYTSDCCPKRRSSMFESLADQIRHDGGSNCPPESAWCC